MDHSESELSLYNPVASDEGERAKMELRRLREAVAELFDHCAEQEIYIPLELKNKILGRSQSGRRALGQSEVMRSLVSSRRGGLGKSILTELRETTDVLEGELPNLELRLKNCSYTTVDYYEEHPRLRMRKEEEGDGAVRPKQKIKTVTNSNPVYNWSMFVIKCIKNGGTPVAKFREIRPIMRNVNLHFESGKSYLLLGAPGSGKSSLLKMIAQTLYTDNDTFQGGVVSASGVKNTKGIVWSNLVSYVDGNIDKFHAWLTVWETCKFAWDCRMASTHRHPYHANTPEVDKLIEEMDRNHTSLHKILQAMGLSRVMNTMVGNENIRGISGAEKKRLTVSEMYTTGSPVLCLDEISTGLDAKLTFDITRFLGTAVTIKNGIAITSLLQPTPETVANFDELILLGDGYVLYSGPIDDVIDHFCDLGYEIPERMDVADWLVAITNKDGWQFLEGADEEDIEIGDLISKHLTPEQMSKAFYDSDQGKAIVRRLETPPESESKEFVKELATKRFRNSHFRSMKLLAHREMLLWWRDKEQLKAKLLQAIMVAVVTGTTYWQTKTHQTKISAIFQSFFYPSLQATMLVLHQLPNRSIFYKHQDANFFPTWTFVIGRSLATIPDALIDGVIYGTLMYLFVGLALNDGASAANYFLFILILVLQAFASGLFFRMISGMVSKFSLAQNLMSVAVVILLLFCGFTVQPDVIPTYWIWAYWMNFFAWCFRGLVINEFQSGKYDNEIFPGGPTVGENVLINYGFAQNGVAFTFEWAWWSLLFIVGTAIAAIMGSMFFFEYVRHASEATAVADEVDEDAIERDLYEGEVLIPFIRADLTFANLRYTVPAAHSNESLMLLKGIDGVICAGRITALMGSSGAGKTTLMDVLSLRKTSGEIEGDVRVNGHPQESISFRRCSGYVEQFDMHTPQLTVRETLEFSAKLRLDEYDPNVTEESIAMFIDQTLGMLELTNLQDWQIGDDEIGGLSFAQKKRLWIAVELIGNPSIIFLDEPTSGLDSRAAYIVMRCLKRIADSGRAVVATIHQPSIEIFNCFDALLLLKRGGEVVFHGELGEDCNKMIEYFERYVATPRIQPGENPANWMLTCIGAGSATNAKPFDYAGSYAQSRLHERVLSKIEMINSGATASNLVAFPTEYAASTKTQSWAVMVRIARAYKRSPSYNVARQSASVLVALLFGSVYATQQSPQNESDMNSRMNSILIGSFFIFVNALNTVLRIFELERNMYYRHKKARMYSSWSLVLAFTVSELPYILLASTLFTVPFYFIVRLEVAPKQFLIWWGFFTLGMSCFTFVGQMMMSLFRDLQTARDLANVFASITVLYSGILIREKDIASFWLFLYWLLPGHYIFEGMITSQFYQATDQITATLNSTFYTSLNCDPIVNATCQGTSHQWVAANFPNWSVQHLWYDALFLVGFCVVSRIATFVALITFDFKYN